MKEPNSDSWVEVAYSLFETCEDRDQEAAELMLSARDFTSEKINKARKCAQHILWVNVILQILFRLGVE